MISPRSTGSLHRLVTEVRLVVGAGSFRPLAPARLDRIEVAQLLGDLGQAAHDRQVRLVHGSELVGIRVDMDEHLVRPRWLEQRIAARRDLSQPASDRQNEVGFAHAICKAIVHGNPEDAGIARRAVVDEVLAAERARDRQLVRLTEREHAVARLGRPAALADDDERPLRRGEELP